MLYAGVSSLKRWAEFAGPPPPPPDLSRLSISSPIPEGPEPLAPTETPPTTLTQWALLILNTTDHALEGTYPNGWDKGGSSLCSRASARGMVSICFAPASSNLLVIHHSSTAPRLPPPGVPPREELYAQNTISTVTTKQGDLAAYGREHRAMDVSRPRLLWFRATLS